jgi:hypothetical protein
MASQGFLNQAAVRAKGELEISVIVEVKDDKGNTFRGEANNVSTLKTGVELATSRCLETGLRDVIRARDLAYSGEEVGCYVQHVLDTYSRQCEHVCEVGHAGLRRWVQNFFEEVPYENVAFRNVVALDTEGHHLNRRPRSCCAWFSKQPHSNASFASITGHNGTVVFRLDRSTWKIIYDVLSRPGIVTAMHDADSDLAALSPLPIGSITAADTQLQGRSLTDAYSAMHAGGPWNKNKFVGLRKSKERRDFYDLFDNPADLLPSRHLRYATADSIATRQLYMFQHKKS